MAASALVLLAMGRYAMIAYQRVEIENSVDSLLIRNRVSPDDNVIRNAIRDHLTVAGIQGITEDMILVYRSNQGRILVKFSYKVPMRLPVTDWGFDISQHIIVDQALGR